MKCAEVAKEFVNDFPRLQLNALYGAVNYAEKFKACEDYPKEPRKFIIYEQEGKVMALESTDTGFLQGKGLPTFICNAVEEIK